MPADELTLPFALAWFRALGSRKLFTTATIDQSAKVVRDMRLGRWEAGRQRFEDADVWLLVGTNPLVSLQGGDLTGFHQHDPIRTLQAAKARGLCLIVVDPRRTETAAWADIHLQPIPGTDAILLSGLLRELLHSDRVDHSFCARHAEGLDALRAAVAQATVDVVAARTGVPATSLVEAAARFGMAGRGMAMSGTGLDMGPHANLAEHLLGCLNVVCGRFPRPGDRVAVAAVLKPSQTVRAQVVPPVWPPPSGFASRVRGTDQFGSELPAAILADEILVPGADRLRALVVSAGNPAAAVPDQRKIVAALSSLELLVTVDPFPSETARLADYVIAPTLALERADFTRPYETSFSEPFAQYAEPILEPPGDAVDDWVFFHGLARRMDLTLTIGRRTFEPGAPTPTSEQLLESFAAGARVSLGEVRRYPGGHVFDRLEPVRAAEPDGSGARFDLLPQDVAQELAEVLADAIAAGGASAIEPPFRLAVRRVKETFNTLGRNIPALATERWNPCCMHPQDLAAIGAVAGERVEITSAHGSVTAVAAADATLRRGVVTLTHCYGTLPGEDDDVSANGSSVSRLLSVDELLQPVSLMPLMTAVPVDVRPAGEALPS